MGLLPFGNSSFQWRMAAPKGLLENSPAFQRRERGREAPRPAGTAESGSSASLFQPSLRDAVFVLNIHSEIASNKEVVNQIALQLVVKVLFSIPSQFKPFLQDFL